ncbi:phosphatase PAP2 family protein [Shouchella lehensis]|uniref:Lipid phosphate phosphatase n=1 Tax=Shouchella lehensis G1 TaxID=1246626 RepID=A0A060LVU9_9BACI|nr:phosphatase PAP2 family protein [Shouchella lehensis]AIC95376.1 lipid phosphate phosphatase [Shouchella lehensis G1]
MNSIQKTPLRVSVLLVVAFFVVFLTYRTTVVTAFDRAILSWFEQNRTDGLLMLMDGLAFVGSTKMVVILGILLITFLLVSRSPLKDVSFSASVLLTTGILNTAAKYSVARVRPEEFMIIELSTYSFPSGHTMGAVSFYSVVAFLIWKRSERRSIRFAICSFSIMMIVLMGLSRVYLGVHFPTDVLGGFFLSGAILTFLYWFYYKRDKHSSL